MSDPAKIEAFIPPANAPVRRSVRVAIDIPVQVFTPKMTCCGRGHELGILGMAVHVPIELAVGETIRLMFQAPGSRMRFGLFGVVRDRQGFRYGLEFLELRAAERSELEKVLHQIQPNQAAS